MPDVPGPPPAGPWRRWLPVAALLVGVLVGAGVTSLVLARDDAPGPDAAGPTPTAGAPSAVPPAAGGSVLVDAACLRAIEAARSAYADIDEAAVALRDLDAAQLDEVVRRLQPVQDRLEAAAPSCQVDAAVATSTAIPTPTPSPAPTSGPGG